jgi:hypothetical protein
MGFAKPARITAAAFIALWLPACASLPEVGFTMVPRAEAPAFDPIAFFAGRTTGTGKLDKGVLGTVPVRVESVGVVEPDGTLVLTQDIYEGEKEVRTRIMTAQANGEGVYEARLSDVFGPVRIWTRGNMMTVRYTMDGNYEVTRVLTLAPDGQRATNATRIELLGATVAVLSEEIVRAE